MSVLSTLTRLSVSPSAFKVSNISRILTTKQKDAIVQAIRNMAHDEPRKMHITPSRYQYTRFKDDLHFYTTLGVVPLTLLIFFVNIFIGPATLTEIPEDYEPKHWEYHKHPITRFIAKYFHTDPQIAYEKTLHAFAEIKERSDWMETVDKAKKLMGERDDYKGWYFIPSDRGRQVRYARRDNDKLEETQGWR